MVKAIQSNVKLDCFFRAFFETPCIKCQTTSIYIYILDLPEGEIIIPVNQGESGIQGNYISIIKKLYFLEM